MSSVLLVDRPRPGVALVTFNRPDRLNALDSELFAAFQRVLPELNADPEVRAIVLTGAGRGFCAGHDLNEVVGDDYEHIPIGVKMLRIDAEVDTLIRLRTMSTPVIAAVNGPARGGGMSIAVACDMRIASTAASFGVAFINIDISAGDAGLSWTLPRLIGTGRAAELMLTGRTLDAEESERIGLVNRVVPADRLVEEALDLAAQVAEHDMLALWLTKRALNASAHASLTDAVLMENTAQVIAMNAEAARARMAGFVRRNE